MTEILQLWQAWEKRTGKDDSQLHLSADGSGDFDECDLYGPFHHFNSIDELRLIFSDETGEEAPAVDFSEWFETAPKKSPENSKDSQP